MNGPIEFYVIILFPRHGLFLGVSCPYMFSNSLYCLIIRTNKAIILSNLNHLQPSHGNREGYTVLW